MVDKLLNLALVGGEPILYLLLGLSVLSIAVAIERGFAYTRKRTRNGVFAKALVARLGQGDIEGALALSKSNPSAEAAVVRDGLMNFDKGTKVVGELMQSAAARQQSTLDKRLMILGTIGSNAPFIGLLGTVLGIIKAFNDLAFNTGGGPSVVMGGIAEALVATAVGLLVAIPAVMFFNYFKSRQKRIMNNISQLQNTLLAFGEEKSLQEQLSR